MRTMRRGLGVLVIAGTLACIGRGGFANVGTEDTEGDRDEPEPTRLFLEFEACDGCLDATDSSPSKHQVQSVLGAAHTTGRAVNGNASGDLSAPPLAKHWHITDGMADFALNGPFTLETWFQTHDPGALQEIVGFYKSADEREDFSYYGSDQAIRSNMAAFTIQDRLIAGQWYHIAWVYDGTVMRAFLNGVEQGEPVAVDYNITDFTDVFIGCGTNADGYQQEVCADGFVDDVRFSRGVRYSTDFTPQ